MEEIRVNTNEISWQASEALPGAEVKPLGDGDPGETPALLLRAPADWRMPAHHHLCTEHHYVLEGEYESDGKVYTAGAYRFVPAGTWHGAFHTTHGVTLLIVNEPPPGA